MRNIFNHYYKKYDNWYDKHKFVYLSEIKAIRKILPKKGKGLEIGVGSGRFAASLGIAIGIDPSKNMIKIARQRGIDARLGNGENLPFRNLTFDYIVIIVTISFVKHPIKVLKEARRVLKRNGKIIIGIIDKDSFLGKAYRKKKSIFYKKAHFYSVKELVKLLKIVKFSKFSYYQTIFKQLDKINSVERPKKGFGKGGFVIISASRN